MSLYIADDHRDKCNTFEMKLHFKNNNNKFKNLIFFLKKKKRVLNINDCLENK